MEPRLAQLEEQLRELTRIVGGLALHALSHPSDKKLVPIPERGAILSALSQLYRELGLVPPSEVDGDESD